MSKFVKIVTLRELSKMENILCDMYFITKKELRSDNREPHIAWPRFILWYCAVKELGITIKSLSVYYKKHHTSVLHGICEAGNKEKADIELFLEEYKKTVENPVQNL